MILNTFWIEDLQDAVRIFIKGAQGKVVVKFGNIEFQLTGLKLVMPKRKLFEDSITISTMETSTVNKKKKKN